MTMNKDMEKDNAMKNNVEDPSKKGRKNRLSVLSQQYDIDGDGVLDEEEKAMRDMDKGDGIDLKALHNKLGQLTSVTAKYTKAKFVILVLFFFCVFTLVSNLVMAFVAVNLSKETRVGDNGVLGVKGSSDTIATKAMGDSIEGSYATNNDGSTDRRNLSKSASFAGANTCSRSEFDPVVDDAAMFRGFLTKQQCERTYLDATTSVSVSVTMVNGETGVSETHSMFQTTSVFEVQPDECEVIKIIVSKEKTWYLRSDQCSENDLCGWFETFPEDSFDVPCCARTFFNSMLEAGAKCTCSKQCKSDSKCVYDGTAGYNICVTSNAQLASSRRQLNEHPFTVLEQNAFNHVGRMTDMSKEFFDEAARTFPLVNATETVDQPLFEKLYSTQDYRTARKDADPLKDEEKAANLDIRFDKHGNNGGLGTEYMDRFVVEKVGNICYGLFRGTRGLEDWGQNINLKWSVINTDKGRCSVRRGYYNSFTNHDLWANEGESDYMEPKLRECASECVATSGKTCTVVLSGHSQGGALATIAAILLHDLNPVIISYAGANAVRYTGGELCRALNQDRIFRFVATRAENHGDLSFDMVPYASTGRMMGHEFLVSEISANSVGYYYYPEDEPSRPVPTRYASVNIHELSESYFKERLYVAKELPTDKFPITLGFNNGLSCYRDGDCNSARCDYIVGRGIPPFGKKECMAKLAIGESCDEHDDCESGSCKGNLGFNRKCKQN